MDLSARERAILDLERGWWAAGQSKERQIRARFGLSATRYYQLLNGLLDRPAALAYDPLTVKRARRQRERRRRAKVEGRRAR